LRPILPAMTSWRPLVAGTLGLFLIILAFLAGQLKGGGDPALGQSRSTAIEQTVPRPTPEPEQGFPAPPDGATPDLSPPTSHQS
jgi:hypothetical protein